MTDDKMEKLILSKLEKLDTITGKVNTGLAGLRSDTRNQGREISELKQQTTSLSGAVIELTTQYKNDREVSTMIRTEVEANKENIVEMKKNCAMRKVQTDSQKSKDEDKMHPSLINIFKKNWQLSLIFALLAALIFILSDGQINLFK